MKTNRLALILTIINLVVLIFVLVQGQVASPRTVTDVLRVRVFEFVDDNGQLRARLNVEPDGQVVFRLLDADGTIRVKLGASEDGSGLVLLNDMTEPGVQILTDQDGTSLTLVEDGKAGRVIEP
jgi:hypothetical protein